MRNLLAALLIGLGIQWSAYAQTNFTLDGERTLVICRTKAPGGLSNDDFIKVLNKFATLLGPLKVSGDLEKAIYFREINRGSVFVLRDKNGQKSEEVAKKVTNQFRTFSKKENLGEGKCDVIPLGLEWMTD